MKKDIKLFKLIDKEKKRSLGVINLTASENYVSKAVLDALGSELTNKYAEGYPGKRYYEGNSIVDEIEKLAIKRALKLFNLSPKKWSANVQPYSGSPANLAVYLALVPLGEKIMGMRYDMGGHLTHGQKVNASGKIWKQVPYFVDRKTEMIDYDSLEKIARKEKPKLIIAGFSAYSRKINWKAFRNVADTCGALLMADISHIAGLIAGGEHPSPFGVADVVTTTIHKTLRGPRSAIIFSRLEYASAIDNAVFPGIQGGPHLNQIAATATALNEAMQNEFKKYISQVVKNTKTLAEELSKKGWRIISGGTDNHLFMIDTFSKGIIGSEASSALLRAGIIVNKNTIPFDTLGPVNPSGIRLGTASITTLGMKESDMKKIAEKIHEVLKKKIKKL